MESPDQQQQAITADDRLERATNQIQRIADTVSI
jgi:hypothetical protein